MSGQIIMQKETSKRNYIGTAVLVIVIAAILIQSFMIPLEEYFNEIEATSAGFMALMALCGIAILLGNLLSMLIARRLK